MTRKSIKKCFFITGSRVRIMNISIDSALYLKSLLPEYYDVPIEETICWLEGTSIIDIKEESSRFSIGMVVSSDCGDAEIPFSSIVDIVSVGLCK